MSQKLIESNDLNDGIIDNSKITGIPGSSLINISGSDISSVGYFQPVTLRSSNLLRNPSFESGSYPPTNWTDLSTPGGITASVDTTVFAGYPIDNTTFSQSVKYVGGSGSVSYMLKQEIDLSSLGFPGPNGDSNLLPKKAVFFSICARSTGNLPMTSGTLPIVRVTLIEDSVPAGTTTVTGTDVSLNFAARWETLYLTLTPNTAANNVVVRIELGTDSSSNTGGTQHFDDAFLFIGDIGETPVN